MICSADSFLGALFFGAPSGSVLHFRVMEGERVVTSFYSSSWPRRLEPGRHYFYGPLVRAFCAPAPVGGCVVFVDVDDLDEYFPPDLEPSAIVQSGRGLHLYWFLDAFLSPDAIRRRLCAAAVACNADRACAHPERFMRVPGSYNPKYLPPRFVSVEGTLQRYSLGEFDRWVSDELTAFPELQPAAAAAPPLGDPAPAPPRPPRGCKPRPRDGQAVESSSPRPTPTGRRHSIDGSPGGAKKTPRGPSPCTPSSASRGAATPRSCTCSTRHRSGSRVRSGRLPTRRCTPGTTAPTASPTRCGH